jgi:WD40 repeat protein
MHFRIRLQILITFLYVLSLSACSKPFAHEDPTRTSPSSFVESPGATLTTSPTGTPAPSSTEPRTFDRTLTQWAFRALTMEASFTETPISTPTIPQIAVGQPVQIDLTPVPTVSVPIGGDRLTQLAKIAQWGKGSVQRVAFSPDGKSLLAASPFGIEVYSMEDLQQPAKWEPFEYPVFFNGLNVSRDGQFVRLQWTEYYNSEAGSIVFDLADQIFRPENEGIEWIETSYDQEGNYGSITVVSPDRSVRFEGETGYLSENANIESFAGQFFNNQTGEALFPLKDEPIYIYYNDYNRPEGCDLKSFSWCGNVYEPNIMAPYRFSYSDNGKEIAILYRAPNLLNNNRFSLLRIYSSQDGSLLSKYGSLTQPIQDFRFQPNSNLLSIAFTNGSIQIWDTASKKLLHQAWDFRPHTGEFALTSDGRYLVTQYSDFVEVMRTSDGAVTAKYEASAFALSPLENLIAIGTEKGSIQVEDLETNRTVSRMEGHTKVIYALVFSPDGRTLTSSSEDCKIRSWDVRTGAFLHYYEKAEVDAIGEGYTKSRIFVYYMQYVPGSDQMVGFGSWGTAASWDASSGAKQFTIVSSALEYYEGMQTVNPHFPQSFWIEPSKNQFYIDSTAYNLENGQPIGGYNPPENLPEGCSPVGPVSADGTVRFTPGYGDFEGQVCALNAQDSSILYRIPVFDQQADGMIAVQQLFLSPEGTRLYVTSPDGAVFVYQIR